MKELLRALNSVAKDLGLSRRVQPSVTRTVSRKELLLALQRELRMRSGSRLSPKELQRLMRRTAQTARTVPGRDRRGIRDARGPGKGRPANVVHRIRVRTPQERMYRKFDRLSAGAIQSGSRVRTSVRLQPTVTIRLDRLSTLSRRDLNIAARRILPIQMQNRLGSPASKSSLQQSITAYMRAQYRLGNGSFVEKIPKHIQLKLMRGAFQPTKLATSVSRATLSRAAANELLRLLMPMLTANQRKRLRRGQIPAELLVFANSLQSSRKRKKAGDEFALNGEVDRNLLDQSSEEMFGVSEMTEENENSHQADEKVEKPEMALLQTEAAPAANLSTYQALLDDNNERGRRISRL